MSKKEIDGEYIFWRRKNELLRRTHQMPSVICNHSLFEFDYKFNKSSATIRVCNIKKYNTMYPCIVYKQNNIRYALCQYGNDIILK